MPREARTVLFGYSPQRYTRRNPRELGFEDRQGYDIGRVPACAINAAGRFVELHTGDSSSSLNLRIAELEGISLNFVGSVQTLSETGANPSIALSDDNDVIVMYDKDRKLRYRLGTLYINATGSHHVYEVQFTSSNPDTELPNQNSASDPSVAVNAVGDVLAVHVRAGAGPYWRRGKLSNHALSWDATASPIVTPANAEFNNVQSPSVAINDSGRAVAVFQLGANLYYTAGTFTPGGEVTDAVTWNEPRQFHSGGVAPSVALTNDGEAIIVFQSSAMLIQGFGKLGHDGTITFAHPLYSNRAFYEYERGVTPQVATNDTIAVQVFNQGNNTLRGNGALLFDHANWMGDHRQQLADKTLAQIALPASHDTGAFANNAARTQDLSIRYQLLYGVRYFDIRPNYDGDKTAAIDDDKIVTYHDLGLEATATIYNGPKLKDVVAEVRAFMEQHDELVILKLSHFRNFNDDVYSKLIALFRGNGDSTGITKWLYTRNLNSTTRLANRPLSDFLRPKRGTVLVLIDRVSNFRDTNESTRHPATGGVPIDFFNDSDRQHGFFRYRDWYDPRPEEGDVTVFDVFSDTLDIDTLALKSGDDENHPDIPGSSTKLPRAQLLKFDWFDGLCRGTGNTRSTTPCDLFLLSWTLTPTTTIHQTAFEHANAATEHLVPYLDIPKFNTTNRHDRHMNLLFTDAVEFSRSTDVAMLRNGLA